MNTMAPIRPTDLQSRRVRLATGPAAAAEGRGEVRSAVRAWDVPVDLDTAVLLTSELVTNAIRHEAGEDITLVISCCGGHLRVDVHDTSPAWPAASDAPADAETGRGLMLVTTLATEWGVDPTPAGKSVYFTLAFEPELASAAGGRGPRGSQSVGAVSFPAAHRPH
jgi:anti-sigma regulatory factor (Ser/Thr protein kinase)